MTELAIMILVFCAAGLLAYMTAQSMEKQRAAARLTRAGGNVQSAPGDSGDERMIALSSMLALICGILGLLLTTTAPFPVPPVAFAVTASVGFMLPEVFRKRKIARRRKLFNTQLVDAMNTMANGLKSGFSFSQSMQHMARKTPDPCGVEFRTVLHEIELGVNQSRALHNMVKRLADRDLELMVMAVDLCMQVGGNLPTAFEQIISAIRERNHIEQKVNALTSQGRMQATIVGLIPFALGIIVHTINPELIKPIYSSLIGWTMIAVVITLDVIGYFSIRKIVSIRY